MKKKLSLVAILLAATTFSMTSCSLSFIKGKDKANTDTSLLLPKRTSDYSATFTELGFYENYSYSTGTNQQGPFVRENRNSIEFQELSNDSLFLKHTAYSNSTNQEEKITESYKVFNLKNNVMTQISSSDPLSSISANLYYSEQTDTMGNTTYTLYDVKRGTPITTGLSGNASSDCFYIDNDNSRVYANYNGDVTVESDPYRPILTENDHAAETANYYLQPIEDYWYGEDGHFNVFDNNCNYLYSVDFARAANLPSDSHLEESWYVGDKIFFQISYQVADDAEDYDVFEEGAKYNYDCYSYDLSTYAEKRVLPSCEKVDFDFVVDGVFACVSNYAGLRVRSIDENHKLGSSLIQTFDKNGNVYVDIQKLMPGAIGADYVDNYFYLYDSIGNCSIYSGKTLVKTISYANALREIKGGFYSVVGGNTLFLYNKEGSKIHTVSNIKSCGTTNDGNVWYQTIVTNPYTRAETNFLYVINAANPTAREIASWPVTPDLTTNHASLVGIYNDICIMKNVAWQNTADGPISKETYSVLYLAEMAGPQLSGFDNVSYTTTYYSDAASYCVFSTTQSYTNPTNGDIQSTTKYYSVTCTTPSYNFE